MQIIFPVHSWVLKKELFDIPLFGWGLRTLDPIAIDRTNSNSVKQILIDGQKKIGQGLPIVFFPEGGTVPVEKNARFKPSVAKLVLNTRVPIVLMAHNSGLFWPKGFWLKQPGLITVKILEVVTVERYKDFDVRTLTDYIEQKVVDAKTRLSKQG